MDQRRLRNWLSKTIMGINGQWHHGVASMQCLLLTRNLSQKPKQTVARLSDPSKPGQTLIQRVASRNHVLTSQRIESNVCI